MGRTMETQGLWILVMSGTRARIVRGLAGATAELVLRSGQLGLRGGLACTDMAVLGQGHGRIGRHSGRRATGWEGLVCADEFDFARLVAAVLETHRMAGDYERLAIFAAPARLVWLRRCLPLSLRVRVVAEVGRNLIGVSEAALPGALGARLRHVEPV